LKEINDDYTARSQKAAQVCAVFSAVFCIVDGMFT